MGLARAPGATLVRSVRRAGSPGAKTKPWRYDRTSDLTGHGTRPAVPDRPRALDLAGCPPMGHRHKLALRADRRQCVAARLAVDRPADLEPLYYPFNADLRASNDRAAVRTPLRKALTPLQSALSPGHAVDLSSQ